MRLKQIRKQKKVSLKMLEEISGVSNGYISELENGIKKNPTYETLKKLSKALEVKVEDLISNDPR